MWTIGGCRGNQACFCVTGGQLSLCQRGGREMGEKGGKAEEKRIKEEWKERKREGGANK